MNERSKAINLDWTDIVGGAVVLALFAVLIGTIYLDHISNLLTRPDWLSWSETEATETYVVDDENILLDRWAKSSDTNGKDIYIDLSNGEVLQRGSILKLDETQVEAEVVLKPTGDYANVYSKTQGRFIGIQHLLNRISNHYDLTSNQAEEVVTCNTLTDSKLGRNIVKRLGLN